MAKNVILSMGRVDVAAGAIVAANTATRGCTAARTGDGVFTLTLDPPVNELDAAECVLFANCETSGFAIVSNTSDAVKTVRTFSAGTTGASTFAAADRSFSFLIARISS